MSKAKKEVSKKAPYNWYANLSPEKKAAYIQKQKDRQAEKRRNADPEMLAKARERYRRYYEEHREEIKARSKRYQTEHRDELRVKHQLYWEAHREELRAWRKDYYRKRRDLKNMSLAIQLKAAHEEIEVLKKELAELRSQAG